MECEKVVAGADGSPLEAGFTASACHLEFQHDAIVGNCSQSDRFSSVFSICMQSEDLRALMQTALSWANILIASSWDGIIRTYVYEEGMA